MLNFTRSNCTYGAQGAWGPTGCNASGFNRREGFEGSIFEGMDGAAPVPREPTYPIVISKDGKKTPVTNYIYKTADDTIVDKKSGVKKCIGKICNFSVQEDNRILVDKKKNQCAFMSSASTRDVKTAVCSGKNATNLYVDRSVEEQKRAEAAKQAAEAEKKRQEAEAAKAAEAEKQRQAAAEAERQKQIKAAADAEAARQKQLADEAERQRQAALAQENAARAAEAERQRQAAETAAAEARRQAEIANAAAERQRQIEAAAAAERQRQAEIQAAAEAEQRRLDDIRRQREQAEQERSARWNNTLYDTPQFGASRGQYGQGFKFMCPNGTYINRFDMRSGKVVDSMRVSCSNGAVSPILGGGGGDVFTQAYSSTGFKAIPNRSDRVIDGMVFVDADGNPLKGAGGGGGAWRVIECPEGGIIVGVQGSYTNVLEKLGAVCSSRSAQYQWN